MIYDVTPTRRQTQKKKRLASYTQRFFLSLFFFSVLLIDPKESSYVFFHQIRVSQPACASGVVTFMRKGVSFSIGGLTSSVNRSQPFEAFAITTRLDRRQSCGYNAITISHGAASRKLLSTFQFAHASPHRFFFNVYPVLCLPRHLLLLLLLSLFLLRTASRFKFHSASQYSRSVRTLG